MEEITSSNRLAYILGIMATSVPALYLLGYFYHFGYLEEYNLPPSLFRDSFEGYLISAFTFFMQSFVLLLKFFKKTPLSILLLILMIWLYGLLIAFFKRLKGKTHIPTNKLTNCKTYDFIASPIILVLATVSISYLILVFIGSLIFGILISWAVGHQIAQQEIKNHVDCGESGSCVSLTPENGIVVQGKVIATSNNYIAIYDGNTVHVEFIQNSKLKARPSI
ncbi:hypothetical protein [Idiomarina xiamenensis]|uniref:Uncharacterized protein n=1 Tax=Idiomarina xiamenensis 10-D-4 TaxID=740709 RepID=K2KY76_9GAMM|nr:hypothetical protein [Idiomarina xiamenensis]EKE87524.1 hypothetical protein A10D4_00470 [Idiomarina xiamenensis 10-D-4]